MTFRARNYNVCYQFRVPQGTDNPEEWVGPPEWQRMALPHKMGSWELEGSRH
jgi:hypothetical protein